MNFDSYTLRSQLLDSNAKDPAQRASKYEKIESVFCDWVIGHDLRTTSCYLSGGHHRCTSYIYEYESRHLFSSTKNGIWITLYQSTDGVSPMILFSGWATRFDEEWTFIQIDLHRTMQLHFGDDFFAKS